MKKAKPDGCPDLHIPSCLDCWLPQCRYDLPPGTALQIRGIMIVAIAWRERWTERRVLAVTRMQPSTIRRYRRLARELGYIPPLPDWIRWRHGIPKPTDESPKTPP